MKYKHAFNGYDEFLLNHYAKRWYDLDKMIRNARNERDILHYKVFEKDVKIHKLEMEQRKIDLDITKLILQKVKDSE